MGYSGKAANNTGSAMHGGMTWRRRIRIERAARLVAAGIWSHAQIAQQIGVDTMTLSNMKQTKQFQAAMIEIRTGVISQENLALARTLDAQKEELADMVPTALMRLRELALSSNPSIALRAVGEILDRDGNHSKVSRTSVTLEQHTDMSGANKTALDIMDVLRSGGTSQFENNEAAPEFTITAKAAQEQINLMAESINEKTLEAIDLSKATKQ
jgi:hypothetical protein